MLVGNCSLWKKFNVDRYPLELPPRFRVKLADNAPELDLARANAVKRLEEFALVAMEIALTGTIGIAADLAIVEIIL